MPAATDLLLTDFDDEPTDLPSTSPPPTSALTIPAAGGSSTNKKKNKKNKKSSKNAKLTAAATVAGEDDGDETAYPKSVSPSPPATAPAAVCFSICPISVG